MEENSIAKKCEICGEIKPIDAFSKSYKNRCKDCVAKMTRLARKEEARKEMDMINESIERATDEYWRQVMVKVAIAAMQGLCSNQVVMQQFDYSERAELAVKQADAFVEELKKSKEFAAYLHKNVEEYYGRECDPKDMYYKNGDIMFAFETGYDEALKSQWIKVEDAMPKIWDDVFVLIEYLGEYQVHKGKYFGETEWRYGEANIIAWMPIPSFDNILEDSKDVLND